MAVYKLFSEQDAFLRSQYPAQNTGRDGARNGADTSRSPPRARSDQDIPPPN